MSCCEYHGINCDQGRNCPHQESIFLPTPEEAEGWGYLAAQAFFILLAVIALFMMFVNYFRVG